MAGDGALDGRLTIEREEPRDNVQQPERVSSGGSVLERLLRGIEPPRDRSAAASDLRRNSG